MIGAYRQRQSHRREQERARKPSEIWVFLNSTFGIFVLSSVFISLFSWTYTQWSTSRAQGRELERTWQRLHVELSNRARYLERITDPFSSREYKVIREAIYGFDADANVNPSWIVHYSPVFPEYRERSFSSLLWEIAMISNLPQKEAFMKLRRTAYLLESCFEKLQLHEQKIEGQSEALEIYSLVEAEQEACRKGSLESLKTLELSS
jgi:hypothetical protein